MQTSNVGASSPSKYPPEFDQLQAMKAIVLHARQLYQQLGNLYEQASELYCEAVIDDTLKQHEVTTEESST